MPTEKAIGFGIQIADALSVAHAEGVVHRDLKQSAQDDSFTILEPTASVPQVVYIEGLMGWLFIERASHVDRYHQVFRSQQSLALTPADSVAWIKQIAETMED